MWRWLWINVKSLNKDRNGGWNMGNGNIMEIVTHEYICGKYKKGGGGGRHENVRVLRKEIKKVVRWESGWMWCEDDQIRKRVWI